MWREGEAGVPWTGRSVHPQRATASVGTPDELRASDAAEGGAVLAEEARRARVAEAIRQEREEAARPPDERMCTIYLPRGHGGREW